MAALKCKRGKALTELPSAPATSPGVAGGNGNPELRRLEKLVPILAIPTGAPLSTTRKLENAFGRARPSALFTASWYDTKANVCHVHETRGLTRVVLILLPVAHIQPELSGRVLHSSPSRHGSISHHHFPTTMEAVCAKTGDSAFARRPSPLGPVPCPSRRPALARKTVKKRLVIHRSYSADTVMLPGLPLRAENTRTRRTAFLEPRAGCSFVLVNLNRALFLFRGQRAPCAPELSFSGRPVCPPKGQDRQH